MSSNRPPGSKPDPTAYSRGPPGLPPPPSMRFQPSSTYSSSIASNATASTSRAPAVPLPPRPGYWGWEAEQEREKKAATNPAALPRPGAPPTDWHSRQHSRDHARADYTQSRDQREREPERAAYIRHRSRSRSPPPPHASASSSRLSYPPPRSSYPSTAPLQVSPPPQPLHYPRFDTRPPQAPARYERRAPLPASVPPFTSAPAPTRRPSRRESRSPPPPFPPPSSSVALYPGARPVVRRPDDYGRECIPHVPFSYSHGLPPPPPPPGFYPPPALAAPLGRPPQPPPLSVPPSRPIPSTSRPPPPPPLPAPPFSSSIPSSATSNLFSVLRNPDPVAQMRTSSRNEASPPIKPSSVLSTHITWPRSPSPPPRPPIPVRPTESPPEPVQVSPPRAQIPSPPPLVERESPVPTTTKRPDSSVPRSDPIEKAGSLVPASPLIEPSDPEASPLLYPPSPTFEPLHSVPARATRDQLEQTFTSSSKASPHEKEEEEEVVVGTEEGADREEGREGETVEIVDAQDLMAEIEMEIEREELERLQNRSLSFDGDENAGENGDDEMLEIGNLEEEILGVRRSRQGDQVEREESPELYPLTPTEEEEKKKEAKVVASRVPSENCQTADLVEIPTSTGGQVQQQDSTILSEEPLPEHVDEAGPESHKEAEEDEEDEDSGDDEAFVASALVKGWNPRQGIPEEEEIVTEPSKTEKGPPKENGDSVSLPDHEDLSREGEEDEGEEVELDVVGDDTRTFEDAIQPHPEHDDDYDDADSIGEGESNVLHHQGSEFDFEMGSGDEIEHDAEDSMMEGEFTDGEGGASAAGEVTEEGKRPRKKRRVGGASRPQSLEPAAVDVESSTQSLDTKTTTEAPLSTTESICDEIDETEIKSTTNKDEDAPDPTVVPAQADDVQGESAIDATAAKEEVAEDGEELEEGELPADSVNTSRTRRGITRELTKPQAALFVKTAPSLLPSGKAAYQRRPPGVSPVTPVGAVSTTPGSTPPPPSPAPVSLHGKGVYVRRVPLAGADPLTASSLSTLNAANSAPIVTSSAPKAAYERPPGQDPTKPKKVKGALPLSPEEKLERLPSKLHTSFPLIFSNPDTVPYSTIFSPPAHSANPSKALSNQPDEKALWGFWPSPPLLKAGKAVFPAPQVVLDPLTNEPTTDPRPRTDVFIDNSNVFYSFLNWVRARKDAKVIQKLYKADASGKGRSVKILTLAGKKVKMDYEVLFGLLERGRKVERRVLVGSSPMWQSLEPAVNWGYEVSLLQRVPRTLPSDPAPHNQSSTPVATVGNPVVANKKRDKNGNLVLGGVKDTKHYKEQAVDELVHLKILESILDYSPPPLPAPEPDDLKPSTDPAPAVEPTPTENGKDQEKPVAMAETRDEEKDDTTMIDDSEQVERKDEVKPQVSIETEPDQADPSITTTSAPTPDSTHTREPRSRPTLVIATGDANSSEYNPGGFLGCVRRALDRGWDVEIASFSTHGLSSLWAGEKTKKVTEEGKARGELRIVNLEAFAEELVLC